MIHNYILADIFGNTFKKNLNIKFLLPTFGGGTTGGEGDGKSGGLLLGGHPNASVDVLL